MENKRTRHIFTDEDGEPMIFDLTPEQVSLLTYLARYDYLRDGINWFEAPLEPIVP